MRKLFVPAGEMKPRELVRNSQRESLLHRTMTEMIWQSSSAPSRPDMTLSCVDSPVSRCTVSEPRRPACRAGNGFWSVMAWSDGKGGWRIPEALDARTVRAIGREARAQYFDPGSEVVLVSPCS